MKFFIFLFLTFQCFGALSERIDALIQKVAPNTNVGIEIFDLEEGKVLYQKNSRYLFTPSSTLKTFTAAAAYNVLGLDFRFETQLLVDKKGKFYLKGSGDPEFSFADLEKLLTFAKGDVIVDNTIFDSITKGPGWMWDDTGEYWDAPIEGFMVNQGCVKVTLQPTAFGKAPLVFLCPKIKNMKIRNLAICRETEEDLDVQRCWVTKEDIIEVKGSIATSKDFLVALESSVQLIGAKSGVIPSDAKVVATHLSSPLSVLVQKMMKESNNVFAEAIFKKMGEIRLGKPGTWNKGAKVVKEYLSNFCEPLELSLVDGSGLSRYNQISPHHYITFIKYLFTNEEAFQEFEKTLPLAGIDGSLQKRMQDPELKGKVFAKTGSMTGACGLTGWVKPNDKKHIAFACISNGFVTSTLSHKTKFEDELCKIILEETGE